MNRKRFIAGARCPKCHVEDRIIVYDKDDQNWMECVACGFLQTEMSKSQNNNYKEIVVKWPVKKKSSN